MSKSRISILSLILVISLMMSLVMAGCAGQKANDEQTTNQTTAEETVEPLEPVMLTWYIQASPQEDLAVVLEEANKTINEKINATLDLQIINWGEYDDKMTLNLSSGQEFDLCFTANWALNVFDSVNKGAFLPLDGLIEKYAPNLWKFESPEIWNSCKMNGKIYAILNGYIADQDGVMIQKKFIDKYSFDTSSVKSIYDIEPLLEKIKKGDPSIIPLAMNAEGRLEEINMTKGYEEIAGANMPSAVKIGDKSLKVVNQYELDSFKNHCGKMREWFLKGYIKEDASVTNDYQAELKAGKYATDFLSMAPGSEQEVRDAWGGNEVVAITVSKPYVRSNFYASMTAINNKSKYPERSLMLLDLIASDKDLSNLLCIGIKDKHYSVVSEDTASGVIEVDIFADSKYNHGVFWEIMNGNHVSFVPKGAPIDLTSQKVKFNENAEHSPFLGFVMNTEGIKTEMANCKSVLDEYLPFLVTGSVDIESKLPEFISKLKTAGSETIISKAQEQIDQWKASR